MDKPKIQFILTGFKEVMGFRVFAFEGVSSDRTRTAVTIRTDLTLTRQYGIRLQELPLLCRAVLEHRYIDEDRRAFTYTEEDMSIHAGAVAERERAAKQKKPRRPVTEQVGTAWRQG